MADAQLRALERAALDGDETAVARLKRARIQAGLDPNPEDNPLREYEGDFVRPRSWRYVDGFQPVTDREDAREDRNADRCSTYRADPPIGLFDLIPIPFTHCPWTFGGDEDAIHVSNRAWVMANHGGACCAEAGVEPDACRCNEDTRCPMCGYGEDGPKTDCRTCEGKGTIRWADKRERDPCAWLVESDLIGGGYLVAILDAPCGCQTEYEDDDPWECERSILETINALADYPLIDDCLHSRAEMHIQMEAWREYARDEFAGFVVGMHHLRPSPIEAAQGLDLDDVRWGALVWGWDEDGIPATGHGIAQDSGYYPEGSGDIHWPFSEWSQHITRDMLIEHGATIETEN